MNKIWSGRRGSGKFTNVAAPTARISPALPDKRKRYEFSNIIKNNPTMLYGGDNGGEGIIFQDHIRSFLGDLRPSFAHCDADIRLFECRRVVYTVSGHADNGAVILMCGNKIQFLLWTDTGKNGNIENPLFSSLSPPVISISFESKINK